MMNNVSRLATTVGLLFAVVQSSHCSRNARAGDSIPRRDVVAKQLAQIAIGDSPDRVAELLGHPDKVVNRDTDTTIEEADVAEIWYYGIHGRNEFPTLGRVYFASKRERHIVLRVFGQSAPSATITRMDERRVRDTLAIVGAPNQCHFRYYDPAQLIAATNRLQPLGHKDAIAVIEEYLRICPETHGYTTEKVWLILRVLFEPSQSLVPSVKLGRPVPDRTGDSEYQLFPLIIEHGLPLLIIDGYELSGAPPTIAEYFDALKTNGVVRRKVLVPSRTPWEVVQALRTSGDTAGIVKSERDRNRIRLQVITMMKPVLQQLKIDQAQWMESIESGGDENWERFVAMLADVRLKWDDETGEFRKME